MRKALSAVSEDLIEEIYLEVLVEQYGCACGEDVPFDVRTLGPSMEKAHLISQFIEALEETSEGNVKFSKPPEDAIDDWVAWAFISQTSKDETPIATVSRAFSANKFIELSRVEISDIIKQSFIELFEETKRIISEE